MQSADARADEGAGEDYVAKVDELAGRAYSLVETRLAAVTGNAALNAYLLEYWRCQDGSRRRMQRGRTPGCAGTFLLALMAAGYEPDALALEMAAGWELFKISVCLFDAVQDEELEPHFARWGSAVASNAALILFVQACDALQTASQQLPPDRRARFWSRFTQQCMAIGTAQHRDLMKTPPEDEAAALAQARGKCGLHMMLTELAAVVAGCDSAQCERYCAIGEGLALLYQATNDLRDLFGSQRSLDLMQARWTLPRFAHHECASEAQRQEFAALVQQLPDSLERVQESFLRSGAMERLASIMNRVRRDVHTAAQAAAGDRTALALLAELADVHLERILRRQAGAASADNHALRAERD